MPARERSRLLHRLADLIERDTDGLINLMIDEIGTPRAVASFMQVPFPVRNFRWFAAAAAGLAAPDQTLPTTAAGDGTATLLTREPIGVVLGLTAWTGTARILRSKTLQVREHEFIVASRALGQSTPRILFRHVLPNVVPALIVQATRSRLPP